MNREDIDLTNTDKIWMWGIVAMISVGGASISAWAIPIEITGWHRPAFVLSTAAYGAISMIGGMVIAAIVQTRKEEQDEQKGKS